MAEAKGPIRVFTDDGMWHVDYGDGVSQDHASKEVAVDAADKVAKAEGRRVEIDE
jgi:hypothetical protein